MISRAWLHRHTAPSNVARFDSLGKKHKLVTKMIAAWESGRGVEEGDRSEESGPICRGGWKGEFECVTRGSPQLLLPFEPGQPKRLDSRSSTSGITLFRQIRQQWGLLLEVASDVPAIMAWHAWEEEPIEILPDVTRTNTKHQRKVHIR